MERVLVDDQFFAEGEEETANGSKLPKKKKKTQRCNRAVTAVAPLHATSDALYMRSNTKALWPMLIEKAWIKLLGGLGYDDICPDGDVSQ